MQTEIGNIKSWTFWNLNSDTSASGINNSATKNCFTTFSVFSIAPSDLIPPKIKLYFHVSDNVNKLNITFLNVCGIKSKLLNPDFDLLIKSYDVLIFTETKRKRQLSRLIFF
jgi:hypothetical protein